MQIYLDSCATSAPRPEIIKLVGETLSKNWGNPSSLHHWGEKTTLILEKARIQVASLINAEDSQSIIFTSGGTEADNLAIFGVANKYDQPQHIITSKVEHSAVRVPCEMLSKKGWQITYLPVDRQGKIDPLHLKKSLQPNTVLVSIIYGQSEVGTIQPISALVKIVKDYSSSLFHTDAVQGAGRIFLDVQKLGVDLLSLSGHKIYGMQGGGALYLRQGVTITPLNGGGGQEKGLRSGTQAISAIASLGLACQLAEKELVTENMRLQKLRDYFFDLLRDCSWLSITGHPSQRLPHHASFIINHPNPELTGRKMVRELNYAGIGISAGSACASGTSIPSPVLLAMGYDAKEATRGMRISFSRDTTREDLAWTAMVIKQIGFRY